MPALGLGLGTKFYRKIGGLDPLVAQFKADSGATDLSGLDALIKYVRAESLLSSFIVYPQKAAQNAGSGSTVYGLGGLTANDMTLVNSPTWGASGITYNSTNQYGVITDFLPGGQLTAWARATVNYPQDNDDTLFAQWETGLNQRSWKIGSLQNGLTYIARSADGGATNFEVYTFDPGVADNADATIVATWNEGAGRSAWVNKTSASLTLGAGSAQTSRHNGTSAITVFADLSSGSPTRFLSGVGTANALCTATLTTTQRETITDLINAL